MIAKKKAGAKVELPVFLVMVIAEAKTPTREEALTQLEGWAEGYWVQAATAAEALQLAQTADSGDEGDGFFGEPMSGYAFAWLVLPVEAGLFATMAEQTTLIVTELP